MNEGNDRYKQTGLAIKSKAGEFAERVTRETYEMQPELMGRFGPNGRRRTMEDTVFNLNYLAESLMIQSPKLFASYISWLKVLLAGYHVSADDVAVNLRLIGETVREELGDEVYQLIEPYVELGLSQVEGLPLELETFLADESPLAEEARAYHNALLEGDRRTASVTVMRLVENGRPIRDIYRYIFQASQYEVGRLWQTNKINVAQEHYCSAATQLIMSQLFPYIFSGVRSGYRLVATCIGEELHEIGLRMLADYFEMDGWDTYYLGANVPTRSIVAEVKKREANVLAISATMTYHVHQVKELIASIRETDELGSLTVLVGGLPFNIDRELWKQVGADGYAPDADAAIQEARRLLAFSASSPELEESAK
ncbi:hypothetical protein J31TS4_13570 [Paenibacillus sp. J31TS4]|uniref:cobalamin B12-binding domain-containing protein n=1 Tax=Paenibacillus sp. J31TS4 TaxID=2807195 RepID=UPI001B195CBE|nr:cobalamin-dependent protein [Paenibacillus sp. J31TS4]GIP38077.1 hypothetical protein J31TS4_13570 [Paenibacillus sp. J31TS4]